MRSKSSKNVKFETSTYTEYSTPKKAPNFAAILPRVTNFLVYFPNYNIEQENFENEGENPESNQKIKLKKPSIKKIFNMLSIPYKNITPYLEFSFSYIKSETVTNTITTFNIDYKSVMKIIDKFYIIVGNEEEDIGISKKSMNKIFNMLQIPMNERLSLIQFYEVDEDIVYEEEEDDETNKKAQYKRKQSTDDHIIFRTAETEQTEIRSSYEKSKSKSEYYTPSKTVVKNNKVKIINTGVPSYTSDKLDKSPMEKLLNLVNNIPTLVQKIKKNKKGSKKDGKKLLIEGNVKKMNSKNITSTILTLKTLEERVLYIDKPIYKYRLKAKPMKKEEPHQKKTVALRVRSRSNKGVPTTCVYAFILRKREEYGDRTMYLIGSLPQLES